MILIYIAKNNNIERIQRVSDETKSKDTSSATFFADVWSWKTMFQKEMSGDNKTQTSSMDAKVHLKK